MGVLVSTGARKCIHEGVRALELLALQLRPSVLVPPSSQVLRVYGVAEGSMPLPACLFGVVAVVLGKSIAHCGSM